MIVVTFLFVFVIRNRSLFVQSMSSFGSVLYSEGLSCGISLWSLSCRVQRQRNHVYFLVPCSLPLRNGVHRVLYLQVRICSYNPLKLWNNLLEQLLSLRHLSTEPEKVNIENRSIIVSPSWYNFSEDLSSNAMVSIL